ncbi:hypothetical protein FHS80_000680 [Porphyromonas circumdentaria]|nr:hypothetical protein [Porphyromonas circumdentaria]
MRRVSLLKMVGGRIECPLIFFILLVVPIQQRRERDI